MILLEPQSSEWISRVLRVPEENNKAQTQMSIFPKSHPGARSSFD